MGCFQETQGRVRNSRGTGAISVQAIVGVLFVVKLSETTISSELVPSCVNQKSHSVCCHVESQFGQRNAHS